jgi:hypothetical protein
LQSFESTAAGDPAFADGAQAPDIVPTNIRLKLRFGRPRARRRRSSSSSMARSLMLWPMLACARGSPTSGRSFSRASSRRRRLLQRCRRPKSKSGGRSSRRQTSRASEVRGRRIFWVGTIVKLRRRQFLHLATGAVALVNRAGRLGTTCSGDWAFRLTEPHYSVGCTFENLNLSAAAAHTRCLLWVTGCPGGQVPARQVHPRKLPPWPATVDSASGHDPPPALQKGRRKLTLPANATRSHAPQAATGCP